MIRSNPKKLARLTLQICHHPKSRSRKNQKRKRMNSTQIQRKSKKKRQLPKNRPQNLELGVSRPRSSSLRQNKKYTFSRKRMQTKNNRWQHSITILIRLKNHAPALESGRGRLLSMKKIPKSSGKMPLIWPENFKKSRMWSFISRIGWDMNSEAQFSELLVTHPPILTTRATLQHRKKNDKMLKVNKFYYKYEWWYINHVCINKLQPKNKLEQKIYVSLKFLDLASANYFHVSVTVGLI